MILELARCKQLMGEAEASIQGLERQLRTAEAKLAWARATNDKLMKRGLLLKRMLLAIRHNGWSAQAGECKWCHTRSYNEHSEECPVTMAIEETI